MAIALGICVLQVVWIARQTEQRCWGYTEQKASDVGATRQTHHVFLGYAETKIVMLWCKATMSLFEELHCTFTNF